MFTNEADDLPATSRWRDDHHELWLAMQTAHAEYRRASDILNLLIADVVNSSSANCGREFELARDEQRAAFESYIDTRLRFSEFLQEHARDQPAVHHTPARFPFAWFVLTAVVSAILGALASYLAPLGELGALQSERDQLSADLRESHVRLDALTLRTTALEASLEAARSQQARQPQN